MAKRTLFTFACLLLALGVAVSLSACGGGDSTSSGGGETSVELTEPSEAERSAEPTEAESPESTAHEEAEEPEESGGKPEIHTEPREPKDTAADTKEIEAAIVASVSEKDPANCTRIEAPGFLEQTTHLRGQEALQACEESAAAEAGKPPRETVDVKSVEAVGESAVALATISGGNLDGQTLEIALRKEGGRWRLGRLIGFEKFDRDAYINAITGRMSEQGGEVAAARGCVEGRLAKVPTDEFEKLILIGSAPLVQSTFENCD
jgi:hypothetical protein